MAPERRTVFFAPHYDDVALSCGGTVAAIAEQGESPLIVTVFGGLPPGQLNQFAGEMHRRWGISAGDALAQRRREERCAAAALGAEACWLDFPDAIYREDRYTSDNELFGAIHADELSLVEKLYGAAQRFFTARRFTPDHVYVPLAVGNHVDHQHVLQLGLKLGADGYDVLAYEDYPYAGDPGGLDLLRQRVTEVDGGHEITRFLTEEQLEQRIAAIRCYESQLPVIFRHQGDPVESTRRWAMLRGRTRPAERFWQLQR